MLGLLIVIAVGMIWGIEAAGWTLLVGAIIICLVKASESS